MINNVVLVGRLTRDPDLRTTGSGISVATFTLAVDRQYTNSQGERGADFINCVIWRKAAENFVNFTSKGSLVGIQGRLQSRSYDNKDGQRVYVTEVVVDNFSFLESRRDRENRQANGGNTNFAPQSNDAPSTNNFGGNSAPSTNNATPSSTPQPQDPFADSSNSIDISDDDLPF
ncbi:single-stranded DNA-binding protein [Lactobacillus sp. PV034]|uniref:single-stranded DNA-binding protein n=1 Tax=Lactobacillus sp. PV034 TaxID=2594495 RepID=UPI00223F4B75|nr:single-stranded DNA-binding protein [Lactobacillus sp. PV034]QNQ81149.1 single-stranded DNA-binding protein [Lactobacillus sp. PV034]